MTYKLELTPWGFQLRNLDTGKLGADVWHGRPGAQAALADVNAGRPIDRAHEPDRIVEPPSPHRAIAEREEG